MSGGEGVRVSPVVLRVAPELGEVVRKVQAGERLGPQDGLLLMRTENLMAVGQLANEARRRRAGNRVYFNNNAHINYSNVCAIHCRFCAFGRARQEPGAYTMTRGEILELAQTYAQAGVTELHIVGGNHPDLPLEFFEATLRSLREALPAVHLKALTAVEIDHLANLAGIGPEAVLRRLQAAGLGSLPGGGAENFSPRVRALICPAKISGRRWLEIHRLAHGLGIRSTATMLYGTVETAEEVIDHLLALRELQDQTGGFQAFVPLAFHPRNTGLDYLPGPTGQDDLRMVAVARLMLDNFKYLKAYWVMLTPRLAQVALAFGANDLDGTVRRERISHEAGATSPQEQTKEDFLRAIREVGLVPAERDTLYRVVREYPA